MHRAVIIGASEEALHTIEKAQAHGLSITALDGNPAALGLSAADKSLVVDISDEQATIEAVRREQPDFVLTVPIGRYLTTIGAVNDALKLPGISREMATLCTDKLKFHQKLQAHDLRSCHCYHLSDLSVLEQLKSGSLPLQYPVIVKPRFGSGSRGIHTLSSFEELTTFFASLSPDEEELLLEECIGGEEYGIDGAVIHGTFYLTLLRKKINTPFPARQAVAYFSAYQDPFYEAAKGYMEKVVACLSLDECLLHADLIQSSHGPFVIELSARPSGHNLHNLFTPLCTGVDPAEEYIKYRTGKPYSFLPKCSRSLMIHYFDLTGTVKQLPTKEQVQKYLPEGIQLVSWNCQLHLGEVLEPVTNGHSLMRRGYFILEGSSFEELSQSIPPIFSLFL